VKGAFLFQIRPDLFPAGFLTPLEGELWGLHYQSKKQRTKR
jgi:hypothetical protein